MKKFRTKTGKILVTQGGVIVSFDKNDQVCDISGFSDEERSLLLNEWRGRPFTLCTELFELIKLTQNG